jgi:hypothetical protein
VSAEPFNIQTTHALVSCLVYSSCLNAKPATAEWGLKCRNCQRNKRVALSISKLSPEEFNQGLQDNYKPAGEEAPKLATPTKTVKELLITYVIEKLEQIDPAVLVPGCTVLLEVNLDGATVDVGVVDNLVQAQVKLAQATEHIQKATGAYIKTTPVGETK